MQDKKPSVYLIAGEPSGDLLGAQLMEKLQGEGVHVHGIGGEHMQAQGLTSLFPMEGLSIIGVWGILKRLPQLLSRIRETLADIKSKQPDVVLTIDSPEFSFRIQKAIRKDREGSTPFQAHLVAPTVWAWRPGRAAKVAQFLDHLFCLYPFEPPLFEKHDLPSTFIGHPIVNDPLGDGPSFRAKYGISPEETLLCLLPGSRSSEISTLLPIFAEAAQNLRRDFPDLRVVIPTVSKHKAWVHDLTTSWSAPPIITEGESARRDAFAASNAALAASGTVAMQLAHAGVPMVIAYKIGPFPRSWMKLILQTPWVSMVNILLQRRAVPELLQTDCTAHQCTQAIGPILRDGSSQERDLKEAMSLLISDNVSICDIIFKKNIFPTIGGEETNSK